MTYRTITVETQGPVEIVTLNRPEALNALNRELIAELSDYVFGLKRRALDVRVVVLRGAGRAFCAGLDIKEFRQESNDLTSFQKSWAGQAALGDLLKAMRTVPQPFIALGHGSACGGGWSLMLASDIRIGTPDLRMNAAYIKIGLGGADVGSSYFLPRLVGAGLASELLLTGRFIHADRALALGLLNDVVEANTLLESGLGMAQEMIANAPYGLSLTKQVLNMNIDAQSMEAAFALEDRQQVMLTATDDHREAMNAFVDKRPPVYKGH